MATQFIGTVAIGTALDIRGFATGIGKLRSAASAVGPRFNNTTRSVRFFGDGLIRAERGLNLLSSAGTAAIGVINGLGSAFLAAGRIASVVSLTTGLVGVSIAKTGFNWRKTWNQARAVTAGTADEMENLKKLVFELGSSTKFTVSEVAGAVDFLGKAGNTAVEQIKLLPTMLDLAAAAGTDLPRTADIMTNIAQGLRIDPSQISRYGDMLTATFLNSNVTLEHLGDTLKKFGPITATLGADFADVATSIGLLGNAGIQGSEAGVHLRRMMINLSDSMSKMRTEVVNRLGLAWDDLDVKTRGFIPVIRTLSRVLLNESGKIKSAEMFALASRIFGARAVSTALALMGQLQSGYDDLSGAIRNSAGAMRDTAAIQLEGLEPFYRLQAAVELLKISIAESGVLDTFAGLAEKISQYFQNMAGASEETRRLAFGILTVVTVAGPAIFILGLLITAIARIGQMFIFFGSVVSFLLTPLGLLTVGILAVVGAAAYLGLRGVDGIRTFTEGSSPLISSLTNVVLGLVGFVKSAIDGDWTTAWGYAKDVIANAATVVVLVMHTLANAVLLVMKNVVHWVSEHWNQIAAGTIRALSWLFSTTEGWLVIFTLLMFKGFRNMAIGVLARSVWMVNKVFGAFKWLALKLGVQGLWSKMWVGLQTVAAIAARGIVTITRRFGVLFLSVFAAMGRRIAAWPVWAWLVSAFRAMYVTIINMTAAFATSVLQVLAVLSRRIGAWALFVWLVSAFRAMYVTIVSMTAAWATSMLITYRTFGLRVAAWQFFTWFVGAFKTMFVNVIRLTALFFTTMLVGFRVFSARIAGWKFFVWMVASFRAMYAAIIKLKAAWATAYFILYAQWGRRMYAWKLKFVYWYTNTFLRMFRTVINIAVAWATTILTVFRTFAAKVYGWKFFAWFIAAFKAMFATVVAVAAAWGTAVLTIFKTFAMRIYLWQFFAWFVARFVAMYKTVLNATIAWGRAHLGILIRLGHRLGPVMMRIAAIFTNPWLLAAAVIIAAIAVFWKQIWRGMQGAGSVIKAIALREAEGFANAWIGGFNAVLSSLERFGRQAVRTLNSIIRKLNRLPFVNIPLLNEGLIRLPRIGRINLGGQSVADAWRQGSQNLSGSDFIDAAKKAWANFKKPFSEAIQAIGGLGTNALNFVKEQVGKLDDLDTGIVGKLATVTSQIARAVVALDPSIAVKFAHYLQEQVAKLDDLDTTFVGRAIRVVTDIVRSLALLDPTVALRLTGFIEKNVDKMSDLAVTIFADLVDFVSKSAGKIGDLTTTVYGSLENFVTSVVGTIEEFVTAIAAGDWKRVGEMAAKALNATVGDAFRFLAKIGGILAESVLAPAGKAAIEAALGGLGYVFKELDLALQSVKALEDVDPEKVRQSIYKILEEAGITPPKTTVDQEIGEGYVPPDTADTPDERKEQSIDFITKLISDLKTRLANLFKPGDDGEPEIPDGATVSDLLQAMNDLGLDVDELGDLWEKTNEKYSGLDPVDPASLTSDLDPGGSSGPSRSLTGTLAGLSLKVLVQIGDRPFEDAVVESLFSADRNGRLQGLDGA